MASSEQAKGVELRNLSSGRQNAPAIPQSTRRSDERELRKLGKRPVLKRSFGSMSILGFSCTVLITWEGALVISTSALTNGGPAGVLWGFLVCWIGSFSTFVSIAELASMVPVSGGQYHWISLLADPSSKKFLSYVTGWVTVLGWQAINISNAYLLGTIIQGTVALTHPQYIPHPYQAMLITWAVLLFSILINVISTRTLARFEGAILFLHLFGFFGVMVPLVYFGPHGDASVFTETINGGEWSSMGLSFVVGLPSLVFTLFGADSAVHMSEEIQNASIAVPQALVLTMLINGSLGFAMLVALMFCIGDITAALDAVETLGFAYLEIFSNAVDSNAGAAAMSCVIIVLGICATVGTVAASARLLWAFARDRAVPFSHVISKVQPNSLLPLNSILLTVTVSMLLSLIALGSAVALNDVLSLSIAGIYSSYLLAIGFLFYRRTTGGMRPYAEDAIVVGPGSLHWGPWRVPEPLGTINNGFACVYLAFMLFWGFWPPVQSVTAATMNYSVVVFSAVVIFSIIWYFAKARRYYTGPVVELDL